MAEIIKDEKDQNIDAEAIDLEQLDNVNGGAFMHDPGVFRQMRFIFNEQDVEILKSRGYNVQANRVYSRGELNDMGIPGSTGGKVKAFLNDLGIYVEEY